MAEPSGNVSLGGFPFIPGLCR